MPENAKNAACLSVNDKATPLVDVSGLVSYKPDKTLNDESQRQIGGYHLKLDKPLRLRYVDSDTDCHNLREVFISDDPEVRAQWENRKVNITGKLHRAASALVVPEVSVEAVLITPADAIPDWF
jgi:hypothetical protein